MWWELVCYEFSRDLQNKEEFLEYRFRFSSGFYRESEMKLLRKLAKIRRGGSVICWDVRLRRSGRPYNGQMFIGFRVVMGER